MMMILVIIKTLNNNIIQQKKTSIISKIHFKTTIETGYDAFEKSNGKIQTLPFEKNKSIMEK